VEPGGVRLAPGRRRGPGCAALSLDQGNDRPVSLYFAALARFAAGDHAAPWSADRFACASSPRARKSPAGSPERSAPTDAAHIDWTVEAAYCEAWRFDRGSRSRRPMTCKPCRGGRQPVVRPRLGLGQLAYAKGSYEEATAGGKAWSSAASAWKIGGPSGAPSS
jgi:hypothetical protein